MCRLGEKTPKLITPKLSNWWKMVLYKQFQRANASREPKNRVCSAERKPEWRSSEIRTSSDMCSALPWLIFHYLLFTLFFTAPVVNPENLLRREPWAARRAGLFPPKSLFRVYIWSACDVQAFNVLTNQFISIQTARCWK